MRVARLRRVGDALAYAVNGIVGLAHALMVNARRAVARQGPLVSRAGAEAARSLVRREDAVLRTSVANADTVLRMRVARVYRVGGALTNAVNRVVGLPHASV